MPMMCDTTSINATHGSNHILTYLGYDIPQDVKMMLDINRGAPFSICLGTIHIPLTIEMMLWANKDRDKNLVAACKILYAHRHLDMKPLFGRKLDLLPYVVARLDPFVQYHPHTKLSSIFEFMRAMPMEVVNRVAGEKKGKKRRRC